MQDRYSGILVHVSSLPGPFGVGTFGPETLHFVRQARQAGFSYWQVLPFTIVDEFNSPYKSYSAFAGNPIFIDPRLLAADGLLTNAEAAACAYQGKQDSVDYRFAWQNVDYFLRQAYKRVTPTLQKHIDLYVEKEKPWLQDYAVFMVAKALYRGKAWWDWEDKALVAHQEKAIQKLLQTYPQEISFLYFQQWVFDRQWRSLKNQANELGLGIIGDMPIYVDGDSCDVWANQGLFEMEDFTFSRVAGVPPDYFSETGQLWGNPLYDWPTHQKTDFAWWKMRLKHLLQRFDRVRIDHFRAFFNYWAVPSGREDAIVGTWEDGPGQAFFDSIFQVVEKGRLIAEDLGSIDMSTRQAIEMTGLPGMKVLQFGIDIRADGSELPHHYLPNTVAYTGTHDNTTALGWIWEADEQNRSYILRYIDFPNGEDWGLGGKDSPFCRSLLRTLWSSVAELTIVPIQDLCGFGGDMRMNTPGRAEENWCYRLQWNYLQEIDWKRIASQNKLYQRETAAREVC